MALVKLCDFRYTVIPAAGEFGIAFDSTRGPALITYASIPSGSAFLAPGAWRGHFSPAVVKYTIQCTGNNVAVDEQVLVGVAGTSSDWSTQGASPSFTQVAAATATLREFTPNAVDWRLLLTSAALPTGVTIWGTVYTTSDRGT